jgi:hypothetical protein
MAFFQRFEFIHEGTQKGVQLVNIIVRIHIVTEIRVDIKMQHCKIGAGLNNKIGIIHRIGYKFVVFDVAFDRDFNGFISSNLAIENFI